MTLEQLKQQDKKHAQVIANYLIKRCEEDKYLENQILTTNKTLVGCIEYCKSQAKKQAENNVAMILDSEVFNWCVHYFLEDKLNSENKAKKAEKTKVSKKEDTLFGEEEIIENNKKSTTPKPKKQIKKVMAEQLSFFD